MFISINNQHQLDQTAWKSNLCLLSVMKTTLSDQKWRMRLVNISTSMFLGREVY